jgi:glycosyltransferase involved in cell wall biosynthesis
MSNVGDVEDMAKNAIMILENEDTLSEFKEHAYLRAKDFDLEKILPMYTDYYTEVLQKSKA